MKADVAVQITVRNLNKMTKHEVNMMVSWLRCKARAFESAVEPGKPWLLTRKEFAGLFHYRLMK